jgi:hypothetical protein
MKVIKPVYRRQEGQTLLYVLCFLFLAIGLVASILDLSTNHRKIARQQVDMESAMYVAEAGLELGACYLGSNITTMAATVYTNGSIGQGSYSCMITQLDYRTYRIISTGIVNNVTRVVRLQKIYQPTYAEFSLWSETNGVIWFVPGDEFWGHVHANDPLYFKNPSGTSGPIFHDACDSLASYYYSQTGGSSVKNGSLAGVEFDKGFQLNTYEGKMADVNFNDPTKPDDLLAAAQDVSNNGLLLQGNTTITFNGATVSITNERQSPAWTNYVYTVLSNQLIYIQTSTSGTTSTRAGRVYMQGGNLTGRATIVADESIYIKSNITYTSDPRIVTNSTDALGMIAGVDVVIDASAPYDLTIQAAIMATGTLKPSPYSSPFSPYGPGSFGYADYTGSTKGTITLYGGIVQKLRGPVGQTSTPRHGYLKNYSYDPRFVEYPPPFYPTISNKLQWSNWREGPD